MPTDTESETSVIVPRKSFEQILMFPGQGKKKTANRLSVKNFMPCVKIGCILLLIALGLAYMAL